MVSADFVPGDPPYTVRDGRKIINFYKNVLLLEDTVHAVSLRQQVMRSNTSGHLYCSALQFRQWYNLLSRKSEKEKSARDDGDGNVTKEVERRKKAVFEVEGIPWHYSREV